MDVGVALRGGPRSAVAAGAARVAIALAMAASLLLVGADRHWAVVVVGVCVQATVALLLVRACVQRDEYNDAAVVACLAIEPAVRQVGAAPACGAPVSPTCRHCATQCGLGDVVWFSREHREWPVYAASVALCPACQTVDACVWSKRGATVPWTDETECARIHGDNVLCAFGWRDPPLSTALVRHLSVREVTLFHGGWQLTVPFEARQVTMALVLDDSERTHSRLVWHRTERHHAWPWYFMSPQRASAVRGQ
ncbi:hypothetical protein pkur_cds_237 [Pandoravirus kuranda]|uniref:Uncharacterized protein n=2 Tax=Pandoravirus TaxID=2060084 RepID=A0AA95J3H3_9VIRU|nr:hypothetical protein pneo_cds_263 [Pandoravirus neocaledonia]AVK75870.1 hypothetical protein pneo_cds_263 [Pandoravirus neocaledonia]WBR14412.1 hypothetical protein pkur_cds_237 [Pandoravirus kuranda]